MVLLSGCAAGDETNAAETMQSSWAKEQDASLSGMGDFLYEYITEELYAERDGNQIYGVAYISQDAGEQMPAVIFSHGFGGNYQVGTQYAEALAAKGYVVYCFDFCGGSPGSRSDGSTLEMSIFTEQADLEAVIVMVQGLDYVDEDRLFLIGTSQGGAVSAITAADYPREIRGAVLLYPAFMLVALAACGSNEQDQSAQGIIELRQQNESTETQENAAESETAVQPGEAAGRQENDAVQSAETPMGSNILIAYFTVPETDGIDTAASASRVAAEDSIVGNTEFIAMEIQKNLGGVLFAIETVQEYPGSHDPLLEFAYKEKSDSARPELSAHIENLEDTIQSLEPDAVVIEAGLSISRNSVASAQENVKSWTDSLLAE